MTRVVQDANRALSVGRLNSTDQVGDYITAALSSVSGNIQTSTSIDNGVISTEVTVPVDDLVAVGFFSFLSNYRIKVSSEHFVEY